MLNEYTHTDLLRTLQFMLEYSEEDTLQIDIEDFVQFLEGIEIQTKRALETTEELQKEHTRLQNSLNKLEKSDQFERGHEFAFRTFDELLRKMAISVNGTTTTYGEIVRKTPNMPYLESAKILTLANVQKELREIAPEGINW